MTSKSNLLSRCYPNLSKAEQKRLTELRERARTDHMFLARLLGFEKFCDDVHKELFDCFVKKDRKKSVTAQDRKYKDRLILWPRGHFKTTAVAVDIIQWILNFPDITIGIMTDQMEAAEVRLAEVKDKFETCVKLARLFPEYCDKNLVASVFPHIKDAKPLDGNASQFTVPARTRYQRDPTVQIVTADSRKAGRHVDVLFCDDLVHEKNYQTKELLEKTISAFKDARPLLNTPEHYRVIIGTRYAFGDLYGWIIDQNIKKKTCKVSSKKCWEKNPDGTYSLLFPKREINGEPVGFTVEGLAEIQAEDPEKFANQYLNSPIVGGTETFPESLLQRQTCTVLKLRQVPRWQWRVFNTWDTAFGQSASACSSAGIVGAYLPNGDLVIIEARGGRYGPHELLNHVLDLNLKYRPLLIGIEDAAGAPLLTLGIEAWVRERQIRVPVEFIKNSNKKDAKLLRIAALRPLLDQGKLWFLAGGPGVDTLLKQLQQFPKGDKDFADSAARLLEFRTYAEVGNQLPDPFSETDLAEIETNGLPWGLTG